MKLHLCISFFHLSITEIMNNIRLIVRNVAFGAIALQIPLCGITLFLESTIWICIDGATQISSSLNGRFTVFYNHSSDQDPTGVA